MPERDVSTVSWINVIPLNRREKLVRWWQEDVCNGSTYVSERQSSQEFMTALPIDEIDCLASEGLKRALYDQKRDIEEGASFVTFPRATPDGKQYLGSIGIPSKPLGVRFTERGAISIPDENN